MDGEVIAAGARAFSPVKFADVSSSGLVNHKSSVRARAVCAASPYGKGSIKQLGEFRLEHAGLSAKMHLVLALSASGTPLSRRTGEMMKPQQAHRFRRRQLSIALQLLLKARRAGGRIQTDGSVAGVVRIKGKGPARFMQYAAGHDQGDFRRRSARRCGGMSMQPMLQRRADRRQQLPRFGLRVSALHCTPSRAESPPATR